MARTRVTAGAKVLAGFQEIFDASMEGCADDLEVAADELQAMLDGRPQPSVRRVRRNGRLPRLRHPLPPHQGSERASSSDVFVTSFREPSMVHAVGCLAVPRASSYSMPTPSTIRARTRSSSAW